METKVCSKCGVEKSVDEFKKNKRILAGIESTCKQCANKRNREYILKNGGREYRKKKFINDEEKRNAIKQYQKQYREKNKEKNKEKHKEYMKEYFKKYKRKYKEKYKEYMKEYKKKYYQDNKEEIDKKNNLYKAANKERLKKARQKWYRDNIETIKKYKKIYYMGNKERIQKKRHSQLAERRVYSRIDGRNNIIGIQNKRYRLTTVCEELKPIIKIMIKTRNIKMEVKKMA
jgi:hypothetical protein